MKKVMNTAIIYFVTAMAGGVFYREFTKLNVYTGRTTLGVVHTHLLAFGLAVFLFTAILFKVTNLENNRLYKQFFVLYNVSLPLMVSMMIVRGIVQVKELTLSNGLNAMISGISGLTHIGVAIALFLFLRGIKKELMEGEK